MEHLACTREPDHRRYAALAGNDCCVGQDAAHLGDDGSDHIEQRNPCWVGCAANQDVSGSDRCEIGDAVHDAGGA